MLRLPRRSVLAGGLALVAVSPASASWASAQEATPGATPVADLLGRYALPGEAVFPEGIAYQPETGDFFVSSVADGTIFRGDLDRPEAEVFLPPGEDGRSTAVGLAVDPQGRLFVAGGSTGRVFVYDATTGEQLANLAAATGEESTFVNDITATPDGVAYATDSFRPVLYRISEDGEGGWAVEEWLDLTAEEVPYGEGFNFNGVVATADGRYLIAVQSNNGLLYRIDTETGLVDEIRLEGEPLTNGDGLVLDEDTLWVVRNQNGQIAEVQLADDLLSGAVVDTLTDPSFAYPTTAALAGDRLLVVNSQFNRQGGPGAGEDAPPPDLPFSVVAVPVS